MTSSIARKVSAVFSSLSLLLTTSLVAAPNYWKEIHSIDYLSVNTASLDSSQRIASYLSVIGQAFPALDANDFQLNAEIATDLGSVIKLSQIYMGYPVLGGSASLVVNSDGKAVSGMARYHEGLTLAWDDDLSLIDDSLSRDSLARSLWSELDTFQIEHVGAMVFPVRNLNGEVTDYQWGIEIVPQFAWPPPRTYSLATGELLSEWPVASTHVLMESRVFHRPVRPSDNAVHDPIPFTVFCQRIWHKRISIITV